ncbi:MAG: TonB-dependent receptor, partial [Dokdonella sp.]
IAGVVNVITRNRFDGAEASAYVGQFDNDDGEKQVYDFTIGSVSERGSVTASVQYTKEDPVWAKDRWYSKSGNAGPDYPGSGFSPVSENGSFFGPCGPGGANTWCTLKDGASGNDINSFRPHVVSDNANSNQQMMAQTGIERRSMFVSGQYNITDNVKFRADMLYNNRSTLQQVAGYPYQSQAFGTPLSADSVFNPLGNRYNDAGELISEGDSVEFRRRLWEAPRSTRSDLETYRFSGGFEGYFDIGDNSWNWDVGAMVNRNTLIKYGHGDASLIASREALGPSFINSNGIAQCGTPDDPIALGTNYASGECTPWNPLLPYAVAGQGALTGDLLSFMFPEYHDTGRTKSTSYTANIAGTIFALPAGDLGIAAGYEHRNEDGVFTPDAFAQSGEYTGLASSTTLGGYSLDEVYVELDIPLLKDLPFARTLSVNVASRYSDYSNFGNTTNNKFGLQWRPIDDLLVRGTYADGFRAPSIGDLYGGTGSSFEYYTDPCGVAGSQNGTAACNAAGVPVGWTQLGQGGAPCTTYPCQTADPFLTGSNPNLSPEIATSKTLGFVYSPAFLEGFDVTLDWWKVKIENTISSDGVDDILNDCYQYNISSRCSTIVRDPVTHAITFVRYCLTNKGYAETEGYDLGIGYRLPEYSIGRFNIRLENSYTSKYDIKADNLPETPVIGYVGTPGTFRLRSNLNLDWTLGDFGATVMTRYYSGMAENCSPNRPCTDPDHIAVDGSADPIRRVGSNTFHDLQFRWTAPWDGTFSVGANNAFGHKGPIMFTNPSSQYPYYGGFDIGRFYYAKYQQRF